MPAKRVAPKQVEYRLPDGIDKVVFYSKEDVDMLRKEKEVICLDPASYLFVLTQGYMLACQGKKVAKITKGYSDENAPAPVKVG